MSALSRRVTRARFETLSGYDIRRRITHLRKGIGPANTLAQIALERRFFARKPTAKTRNYQRVG